MEKFSYHPKGVCARQMNFEIENNQIQNVEVIGGCQGNLKGICNILKNKSLDEVISAFDGVQCGMKGTSCPDQIACALKKFKQAH